MATRQPIGFFDLPGEIRNQIYAHLLVIPAPKYLDSILSYHEPMYPSILRVSKQTYSEALPILYRQNTFYAHPSRLERLPQIRRWLDPVAGPGRERVQKMMDRFHISVRLECDAHFEKGEAERAFTGRDALTIQVYASQYHGSGGDVLRLFEGVRAVRNVDIYGNVDQWPKYVASLRKAIMAPEGTEVEIDRSEFDDLTTAMSKANIDGEDSGVDIGEDDITEDDLAALDAWIGPGGALAAAGYG